MRAFRWPWGRPAPTPEHHLLVQILEYVRAMADELNELNTAVGDLTTATNALAADVAAETTAIGANTAAVGAATAEITTLLGQITSPGVDPAAVASAASAIEAQVAAINTAKSGIEASNTTIATSTTALASAAAAAPAGGKPPVSVITLSPATLPDPVVGEPYTASLSGDGSTAIPLSFSIASGALPDGLTLSAGGGITGTPTTVGVSQVSIQAHDTNNDVGVIDYTVTVDPAAAPSTTLSTGVSSSLSGVSSSLSATSLPGVSTSLSAPGVSSSLSVTGVSTSLSSTT